MTRRHYASLTFSLTSETCQATKMFVHDFLEQFTSDLDLIKKVDRAVDLVYDVYTANNRRFNHPSDLNFEIERFQESVLLTFTNKGMPVYHGDDWKVTGTDQYNNSKFVELTKVVDHYETKNLGRVGQSLSIRFKLSQPKALAETITVFENDQEPDITIRKMNPGEEPELSRLFYKVYGYNYINEMVYFPARIKDMIEAGDLESYVAIGNDERMVGHVGLIRHHRSPNVYEAALGLTDPAVISRGLFSQIFGRVIEEASKKDMAFCVYDFVTNLIYSQKLVAKYGSCEMSINIGCQLSETQAKLEHLGMGEDPKEMDRYSILLGIKPGQKYPLGERVTLPLSLGEIAEFILEPLNISWMPSPRFFPMMREGQYTRNLQPTQRAVYYRFYEPGQKALRAIINDWKVLLRSGYQYAAIDMPLDKPGIGQMHDILAASGFFMAGFIPYEFTPRLGFRFQSIGPTKVAFDKIQVFSESAKKLKDLIQEDYERNVLI